jgi:tubulin alpha
VQEKKMPQGEIISLHVGQCGIQQAQAVWRQLFFEHNTDESTEYVLHDSIDSTRARAVLIDTEPTVIDSILASPLKPAFWHSSVKGTEDAASNFARGFLKIGNEIHLRVVESLRSQLECCENPNAFFMFHSNGGGTGSGYGTLLLQHLSDFYSSKSTLEFVNQPSDSHASTVEPLNACLALSRTMKLVDIQFTHDNSTLASLLADNTKLQLSPTFADLNELIGVLVSYLADGIRSGMSIRHITQNLVPFPRINLVTNV